MDFDVSDLQQMLLDSADRLMKERGDVEHWRARRALPNGFDAALWWQFADLGWLALDIPEEHGGLGGSFEDMALLMTAFGRGLDASPFVSTAITGARILARASNREAAAPLLEMVAAGDARLALAHAEEGERYEMAAPRRTVARTTANGIVLDGIKRLVLDAPAATTLLVTAMFDDRPGTAILALDPAAPGVTLESYPLIDGAHAADLRIEAVALSGDALLVEPEAGVCVLREAADRTAIALLAQAVGAMEACQTVCADYMKERRQFGQPIGRFQALQHIAADMFVATHQTRSMLYQALAGVDALEPQRRHAVSAAKIVAGEAMLLVARNAIQTHGGYGVTDEYAVSHFFKRLVTLEKLQGDVQHHVQAIAALDAPHGHTPSEEPSAPR